MALENENLKGGLVTFSTSSGLEMRGTLLRLERGLAAFEVYGTDLVIKRSDALQEFRIIVQDRPLYSGRAVVSDLVHAGTLLACEAKLDEQGLNLGTLDGSLASGQALRDEFEQFMRRWQSFYTLTPDFKDVIADLQNFLSELRLWLDQLELEIRSSPSANRLELERKVLGDVAPPAIKAIDTFIERFEALAEALPQELRPIHRVHFRRQLHPLLLCSPFAYRAFQKPLGYAGDYEMVSMMLRSPSEGSTLFAKVVNVWLLSQAPARAHRNRVEYLERRLLEEALRLSRLNRPGRVYNLACGPATEIENFLRKYPLSNLLHYHLVDFNAETLEHARKKVTAARTSLGRNCALEFEKRAVQALLKESARPVSRSEENLYDVVYCAGLYDYLSDAVCKRVTRVLYDMVAPGGLLLVTNVTDAMNRTRPFRHSLDYLLDWHLIYRNGAEFRALFPALPDAETTVLAEETGVNVFAEVRRRAHG